MTVWPEARAQKFRQAAIAYLHVIVLYEAFAYRELKDGLMPTNHGPPLVWMVAGAVIGGLIVWGLWHSQNVWLARLVWLVHGLRLPAMIENAFISEPSPVKPGLYVM